jgi:hypothetical protein
MSYEAVYQPYYRFFNVEPRMQLSHLDRLRDVATSREGAVREAQDVEKYDGEAGWFLPDSGLKDLSIPR